MVVSRYHKFLRVSAIIVMMVLIFDGGFISPVSKELSNNTLSYLASSIGIYAAVEPNEINQLSAELNAREQALTEREIAARSFGENGAQTDYSTYILSSILFVLTVLIVLNYLMDWARVRRLRYEEQAT